jgi:FlaA1/EpsC-like NDP-sugar epimerase
MTRFVMTVQEAAKMVLEAAIRACGGEVLVTKMPALRIADLAEAMISLMAPRLGLDSEKITIKYVGARPGEKLYEELMTTEEVSRVIELPTMFAIMPSLKAFYHKINYSYGDELPGRNKNPEILSLKAPMSVAEIKDYLMRFAILDEYLTSSCPLTAGYETPPLARGTAFSGINNNFKSHSG